MLKCEFMIVLLLVLKLIKPIKGYFILKPIRNITGIYFSKIILLIFLLFLFGTDCTAQNHSLSFEVWKNNSLIGFISMTEKINADSVIYDLSSEIKAKIILNFNIVGIEKAIYENGLLVYSSVYRKINSNEKTNKKLFFLDGKYYLIKNGKKKALPFREIKYNLVTLYFYEPLDIKQIYCDNHHNMVRVVFIENGKYQVTFPDGSYNIFYYTNGKCTKVDAFGLFYEVQLISAI